MAYPRPFLRLVYIGSLYGTETFSFSMSLLEFTNGPAQPPTSVPQGVIDAGEILFQSTGLISSKAQIEVIKLNRIGTDGKYTEPQTVEEDVTPPTTGTTTLQPAPQVAIAITLRTAVSRGLAHAGRFYLPLPGTSPSSDGRLPAVTTIAYADAAAAAINAINASFNDEWRVGVTSNVGAGREQFVTAVQCGRVLDTIRSRRSSLPEDYESNTLPIA